MKGFHILYHRRKIDTPYRIAWGTPFPLPTEINAPYHIEGGSPFSLPTENRYTVSHRRGYTVSHGRVCCRYTVSNSRWFPISITDGKSIHRIALYRVPSSNFRREKRQTVSHRRGVPIWYYQRKIDIVYRIAWGSPLPLPTENRYTVSHRKGFTISITDRKSIHRRIA